MNYISAYSRIRDGVIEVNGKQVASTTELFPDLLDEVYSVLNPDYPKFYKMDNLSKLGFLACEYLLKNFNFVIDPYDVALVLTNSSSSLDNDVRFEKANKIVPSPGLFVYTLPNIVLGELCIRHGFKGEQSFFITPHFDTDLVFTYCNALLEEKTKICIAGWIEVLNHKYDAFLYLIDKQKTGISTIHSADNIKKLYKA